MGPRPGRPVKHLPLAAAGLIVAAYLGFELYALKRLGYRTEPLYIHDQFVAANRAAERCGDPPPQQWQRFLNNIAFSRRQALAELAAEPGIQDPAGELAAREAAKAASIDALIDAEGCDAGVAWQLVKLHEIKARLSLR